MPSMLKVVGLLRSLVLYTIEYHVPTQEQLSYMEVKKKKKLK